MRTTEMKVGQGREEKGQVDAKVQISKDPGRADAPFFPTPNPSSLLCLGIKKI